jgi:hypothetical protein
MIEQIRNDQNMRDDFLQTLAQVNRPNITGVTLRMIGRLATEDVIDNEATQAFLLGANKGVNSFKNSDDGRGKNNFTLHCRWRGLNNVQDWCRSEYGTPTRYPKRYFERTKIVLERDLYDNSYAHQYFIDVARYEDHVLSAIAIREMIAKLSPVDRSIIELLIFGSDDYGTMRNSSQYGSRHHHIAADVALTIGKPTEFVYTRIAALRKVFGDIAAAMNCASDYSLVADTIRNRICGAQHNA